MDEKQEMLIERALELGLRIYTLETKDIKVENRVRLKCAYGCRGYGKRLSCPPHVMDVDEFRNILKEYSKALLLIEEHDMSNEPDILKAWSHLRRESFRKMLELEYLAFRQGFIYAQLLRPGACNECDSCAEKCRKPEFRRFPPEAAGINVGKIMEMIGETLVFCDASDIKCIGILLLE
jgi:predicted metal-binding protein